MRWIRKSKEENFLRHCITLVQNAYVEFIIYQFINIIYILHLSLFQLIDSEEVYVLVVITDHSQCLLYSSPHYIIDCLMLGFSKGLVIYNPAVGGWSSSKQQDNILEPPSQGQKPFLTPSHEKLEIFDPFLMVHFTKILTIHSKFFRVRNFVPPRHYQCYL